MVHQLKLIKFFWIPPDYGFSSIVDRDLETDFRNMCWKPGFIIARASIFLSIPDSEIVLWIRYRASLFCIFVETTVCFLFCADADTVMNAKFKLCYFCANNDTTVFSRVITPLYRDNGEILSREIDILV